MAIHRKHPILNEEYEDPQNAELFDDCERCDQHARSIVSMDDTKMMNLWLEMMRVEYESTFANHYRTKNEATACRYLHKVSLVNMRLFNISPLQLLAMKQIINSIPEPDKIP